MRVCNSHQCGRSAMDCTWKVKGHWSLSGVPLVSTGVSLGSTGVPLVSTGVRLGSDWGPNSLFRLLLCVGLYKLSLRLGRQYIQSPRHGPKAEKYHSSTTGVTIRPPLGSHWRPLGSHWGSLGSHWGPTWGRIGIGAHAPWLGLYWLSLRLCRQYCQSPRHGPQAKH